MHQPIRDNLEEYLKGAGSQMPQEFNAHLASCHDCAAELRLLEDQAAMLRSLQAGEVEPSPGFYARVRERIEEQAKSSIWSVFLDPSFGRRLAVASAALVLLLATYLVTTEPGDHGNMAANPVVVLEDNPTPELAVQQQDTVARDTLQQERDAVLVNLASYHE